MILQSLTEYYNILSNDEDCNIPKLGFSKAKVSFALNLAKNGEPLSLIPLFQVVKRGKQETEIALDMTVPEQVKRSSGVAANFLCDIAAYVFGLDKGNKPERAKQCFEAFKTLNNEILKGVLYEGAQAVLKFLENWNLEEASGHPVIVEHLDELLKGGNIVFKLHNELSYIHQNPLVSMAWADYNSKNNGETTIQCLVTGEQATVARLHPVLKGVRGAQAVGASLVSFNAAAYESYGKSQGENAPVGKYAAFAYTTALNHLLKSDRNKLSLGDTTVVMWAQTSNPIYDEIANVLFDMPEQIENSDNDDNEMKQDVNTENILFHYIKAVFSGNNVDLPTEIDENTNFNILGISPNAARLSVNFYFRDTFGGFAEKIKQHYDNLRIDKRFDKDKEYIPMWLLMEETVSANSTKKAVSPLLASAVLRAVLLGLPYPQMLLNAVLTRIKAEHDITYVKASIIKACLLKQTSKFKEVLIVSLNEQSNIKAYVLGRLFAYFERAQEEANGSSNIKARFFTTACATPISVFPTLLRLVNHHIVKATAKAKANGKPIMNYEKKIGDILEQIPLEAKPFPAHLSPEEQGVFILGYYHQRNNFFKPTKKGDVSNA